MHDSINDVIQIAKNGGSKFGILLVDRQTAKFNVSPNFPCLQYYIYRLVTSYR